MYSPAGVLDILAFNFETGVFKDEGLDATRLAWRSRRHSDVNASTFEALGFGGALGKKRSHGALVTGRKGMRPWSVSYNAAPGVVLERR